MKKISVVMSMIIFLSCFSGIAVNADLIYTVYEAERAYRGGYATVVKNNNASGGAVVENIGGPNTDVGTVVFEDVYVEYAGSYSVEITYMPVTSGTFYISANNSSQTSITLGNPQNEFVTKTASLKLKEGYNEVKIYSTNDKCMKLDCIKLSSPNKVVDGVYDDDMATISGDAKRRIVYGSDNGYAISGLGASGSAEFIVDTKNDNYILSIWYSSYDYRSLEVYVDDVLYDTVFCPITGEDYNIESVTLNLDLTEGTHKLKFTNSFSNAPDIDKIHLTPVSEQANNTSSEIEDQVWEFSSDLCRVEYDAKTGMADFFSNGVKRVSSMESAVKLDDYVIVDGENVNTIVKSSDYDNRKLEVTEVNDNFGQGKIYNVISTSESLPTMIQKFYVYMNLPYVLVQVELISDANISTNFMAPISAAGEKVIDIGEIDNGRVLFVPYDNDNWNRYNSETIRNNHTSYWVTAVYDNTSRNSVVCGSIDHDTFKTAVSTWSDTNGNVKFFGGFGGVWSRKYTYDYHRHGSIDGNSVSSPRFFLGYFDDWRVGMETYGDANSKNIPKLNWSGGVPFGYNSWYAQGTNLNYDDSAQASDFISTLDDFNSDENVTYINLDSYWDFMSDDDLRRFVKKCKENGQKPGIYWSHFVCWSQDMTNWSGVGNSKIREAALEDKYGNVTAMAKDSSNYPLDPTSYVMKARMDNVMNKFKEFGFEFLKVDFLNYASIEGEHKDKSVKTGMQAYNQALESLTKYVDTDKFFISYSIAPLFPYQYAHGRRISCDIGSDIGSVEYLMNSLSYGWWMDDSLYSFTDPDHIAFTTDETFSRTRYNSAVISGTMMLLSNKYSDSNICDMTRKITSNKDVNNLARLGKAFMPIEGNSGSRGETAFILNNGDDTYLALFNYSKYINKVHNISFDRIGLESDTSYTVTDLWTGSKNQIANQIAYTLKPQESLLIKLDKSEIDLSYIEDFESENVLELINQKQDGWSYNCTEGQEENIHLWIGDNGSSSNSLRLSATDWYKTNWLTLDILDNGISKKVNNGLSQSGAETEMCTLLNGNMSLSFDLMLEQEGEDKTQTHISYARIKSNDDHGIAELITENRELFLVVLNPDGNGVEKYKICDLNTTGDAADWHSFKFIFDQASNMFQLYVDSNLFKVEGNEWIVAADIAEEISKPFGMISKLEIGNLWSAYWQQLHIDNIKVETSESEYLKDWEILINPGSSVIDYGKENSFNINSKCGEIEDGEIIDIYVVTYQGDMIKDISVKSDVKFDLYNSCNYSVNLTVPDNADNDVTIKAYIWNDKLVPKAQNSL